jgi:integrase
MAKLRNSKYTTSTRKAARDKSKRKQTGKFNILFWQRTTGNREGYVTINCRLTYTGQRRKDVSTGIQCKVGEFDGQTQTTPNDPNAARLLSELHFRLQATFADFRITGRPVEVDLIWRAANGILPQVPDFNIMKCLETFFTQRKEEYEIGEVTLSTFKKWRTWNKRLKAFLVATYGTDGELEDITPADAKKLLIWLKKEHGYTNNVAVMIVGHFKRILNFALENEWIIRNPLMNYRRKFERMNTERLTEDEVETLRTAEIFAPAVEHIRRAFIFQIFTGLSYAELSAVTVDNILIDERTRAEYIKISRAKTQIEANIPLRLEARKIIDSFADHPARIERGLLIPIISNQKYNTHLKQLAGLVGIKKRLTTHMARRTAATLYLNMGVPLESVSAMLGHTNTQVTQKHYTRINEGRIIDDMDGKVTLSRVS